MYIFYKLFFSLLANYWGNYTWFRK